MSWIRHCLCVVLCCTGLSAHALQLSLPGNARQTASRDSVLDQVAVATAPYQDGALAVQSVEGPVTRRAYRIPGSESTPLQILQPLRAQIEAAGYTMLLDCNEDACGGFDFRFAIDVLPAPNMYVNIRDYHFLSAYDADTDAYVTLLASAAAGTGYLQVVQVGKQIDVTPSAPSPAAPAPAVPGPAGDLDAVLIQTGSFVLKSLDFAVGTTALSEGPAPELAALANLMQARPDLRIAVVGHTDTVGGLDANIAVSRARARAVRTALINSYGVEGDRIEAEGMGYLSPIASNLTAEGREANRRVEVIVVDEGG